MESSTLSRLLLGIQILFKTVKSGRSDSSDIVVWNYRGLPSYFGSAKMLKDYSYINALTKMNKTYRVENAKTIGKCHNKTVIMSYCREIDDYGFSDYTKHLFYIIKQLEAQGNHVYPNSMEFLFWENKAYMHQKFKDLGISEPETEIVESINEIDLAKWNFPFLIKEVHSAGGEGVHKVNSKQELEGLNSKINTDGIIVQELLNMRRDLRVILVGNKIEHFYWRINNSDIWKPTSTGQGSSVDFENFPEKWRDFIIQEFQKLGMLTGAFDVAWRNDDLNTIPLILEVSPTYQLNPKITDEVNLKQYGKYKKRVSIRKDGYNNQYILQTYKINEKLMQLFINQKG